MPYSQSQLDALDADIAAFGTVESTSFADQQTRFRSLDELLRLRALMAADVAAQAAGSSSRVRFAAVRKGA